MYEAGGGGGASNRKMQNNSKRFTISHIEAGLIVHNAQVYHFWGSMLDSPLLWSFVLEF